MNVEDLTYKVFVIYKLFKIYMITFGQKSTGIQVIAEKNVIIE